MTSAPFNLGEKKIDLVPSTFSGLKNSLTLVKEQDGVIDLRFSEDELEVLASTHGPQGGKVDQQNLHHNDKNLKSSLVSGIDVNGSSDLPIKRYTPANRRPYMLM